MFLTFATNGAGALLGSLCKAFATNAEPDGARAEAQRRFCLSVAQGLTMNQLREVKL